MLETPPSLLKLGSEQVMIKEVEIDKIYSKIKAYLENKNPYVRYRAAE